MRAVLLLSILFGVTSAAVAAEVPRFSGEGALVEGARVSSDGRFALQGELDRGEEVQRGGRFSLSARLAASELAKSTNTACVVGGVLFANGFEG